jgi:class 3 adenylate cyclase
MKGGGYSEIYYYMAAFITRKKSMLIMAGAFLAAAAVAVLLNYLLEGPRLGPHYDILMGFREGIEPAPELLIVDSEDLMESGAAVRMIQTLIEMDAAALVIQTPVLGFAPAKTGSGEDIRYRFEEEYSLLERNIRNLFEAIRAGSIAPGEVHRYVDELVDLSVRGKERLTAALLRQDEAGIARLERVAAAFGRVYRAGDLRLSGGTGAPYSRPRPDWDGRVRRMAPVEPGGPEHVVYAALKGRFTESLVGTTGSSLFLINSAGDGTETFIPLDSQGNLLFEAPAAGGRRNLWGLFSPAGNKEPAFRRIPLDLFNRYEEAGQKVQRLLREADKLGIYSVLEPERSPVYLFDYALAQREEFLVASDPGNPAAERFSAEWKARWLGTLGEYFEVLEQFLYGPAEQDLKAGYEELLVSEALDEEGLARIGALRDELTGVFEGLREAHRELWLLRETLSQALAGAFVILGPGEAREQGETDPSPEGPGGIFRFRRGQAFLDSELSFILADSLIQGRGIRPLGRWVVLPCSFLVLLLELLILARLGPFLSLILGCVLSLALGAGFSWAFVVWGRWLDPLSPGTASLAGTLCVVMLGLLVVRRGGRRFRRAYGPYVGKSCLRQLIRAGRPAPAERLSGPAAIIAVRGAGLLAREDQEEDPLAGARAVEGFREEAARIFKRAGGVILGCDGDLVLACFGSPLERIGLGPSQDPYIRYSHTPALRAAEFVADLAGQEQAASWRFGIDAGECGFGYLAVAGYCGYGRPVVRARILSGLCSRYKTKVLVSESVRSQIKDIPVRRLTVLKERNGSGGEAFYELVFPEPPAAPPPPRRG